MFTASFADVLGQAPLDQSLVPWLKPPVYLADVDTPAEALQYAAGGFHVAVARAKAGGCSEDPTTWGRVFLAAGYAKKSDPGTPCGALNVESIRSRWQAVAGQYRDAYGLAQAQGYNAAVRNALQQANVAADGVYGAESAEARGRGLPPVVPPRDPRIPAAPEAAGARPKGLSTGAKVAAGVAVVGGIAAVVGGLAVAARRRRMGA